VQPLPDKSWRLGEYLDHWLENDVANSRPLTHVRYESIVRLHLKPYVGQYRLAQLSVATIQAFFDRRTGAGTSPSTIHNMRKVLSSALTSAQRQELVFRNVARLVKLPRYKVYGNQPWSVDESRRFLEVVKGTRLYAAYLLCILYGFRCGEVLGLRWVDIDYAQQMIHVRQQLQRVRGELRTADLKTDAGRRDEPLIALAAEHLLVHRQAQACLRHEVGEARRGDFTGAELVFTTKVGTPIEPRNFLRDFQAVCDRHGLRRIKVHDLRDTNGTIQKDLNIPDRDIQAVLGHANVDTTRRYYQHVTIDNQRNALEKVEKLFLRSAGSLPLPSTTAVNQNIIDQIASFISGAPGWTRTNDLRLRSPLLYPAELPGQNCPVDSFVGSSEASLERELH
jgi:integrase